MSYFTLLRGSKNFGPWWWNVIPYKASSNRPNCCEIQIPEFAQLLLKALCIVKAGPVVDWNSYIKLQWKEYK